ncbi:hypothetical protein BDZ89DRAFT_1166045 [Hymenopellis radicata]|nr:hypothetical protein BDZ89DRAFT_1166552 [Hymenopellis radicata]KAF9016865.1 hypothetical protein BDZ89DRAFT_1166045 [Hymenopellis radicata]
MIPVEFLPPGFEISQLSGPAARIPATIIGYFLHGCLFGTLTVQFYIYYEAFPKDRLFTKCLVYGTYTLELVQTILVAHDAFAVFGSGFGDLQALTDVHLFWFSVPVMSGVVAFVGQSFYAYRIHVLSKTYVVPVLIVIIALTSSIAAFVVAAFVWQAGNLALLNNQRTSEAVGVWGAAAALADILIAICMTYYLLQKDTGFRHTQVLLSKLIRLTVETGTVTAAAALTGLILFFVFPGTMYYGCIALLVPKLYGNMMFMVLNSRLRIVGGRATYTSCSDMVSIPSFVLRDDIVSGSGHSGIIRPAVSIKREVFRERDTDDCVEMKIVGESRSTGEYA